MRFSSAVRRVPVRILASFVHRPPITTSQASASFTDRTTGRIERELLTERLDEFHVSGLPFEHDRLAGDCDSVIEAIDLSITCPESRERRGIPVALHFTRLLRQLDRLPTVSDARVVMCCEDPRQSICRERVRQKLVGGTKMSDCRA